jgi:hypothetical protein
VDTRHLRQARRPPGRGRVSTRPAVLRFGSEPVSQLPLDDLAVVVGRPLHFVVTIGVLVWLWRTHPDWYRRARRVIIAGTLIALAVFWLYPAAPPRLLAGSGFIDTNVAFHTIFDVERGSTSRAADLYATMPSLHLGWALWCPWAVAGPLRSLVLRRAAYLYPLLTALVVMATGNHFFLDLVGGAAVMALGWVVGIWIPDACARYRSLERRPVPASIWVTAFGSAAGPIAVFAVLRCSHGLAASALDAIGHADPIWLVGALVAEAGSMAAFAGLQRRALRTAGVAVSRRTATAITFASNAISSSIPLVGSVAGTTNTWRQYHRRGAGAGGDLGPRGQRRRLDSGVDDRHGIGRNGQREPRSRRRGRGRHTRRAGHHSGRRDRNPGSRPAGPLRRRDHRDGGPDAGAGTAAHDGLVRPCGQDLHRAARLLRPDSRRHRLRSVRRRHELGIDALTLALAIQAAGGHVPLTDLIIIWATAGTATSVSLTPSGIGVVEPVLAASLALAGLPHATAIAATLLYRSISLVLVVLVGWLVE